MEDLNKLFAMPSPNNDISPNSIFEKKEDSMFDYLPFKNTEEKELIFDNIFDIDYSAELFSTKYDKYDKYDEIDTKQIIERLNSFDNDFFKKIVVEDTNSLETDRKLSFKSNLMIAEKTLQGIIISFMHKKGEFVTEEDIINFITPKFTELRKTNGACYQVFYYIILFF